MYNIRAEKEIDDPMALAIDSANNVIVGDTENNRVDKSGVLGAFITDFDGISSGCGASLNYPEWTAVGANGDIYVESYQASQALVFTSAPGSDSLLVLAPGAGLFPLARCLRLADRSATALRRRRKHRIYGRKSRPTCV